jgi:hypothetical protein
VDKNINKIKKIKKRKYYATIVPISEIVLQLPFSVFGYEIEVPGPPEHLSMHFGY